MSKISVNPEILRWARETAGLPIDVAAKKLAIGATKDLAPEQRLAQLESGDEQPTRALLLKMAKQYRRSLLIFYLSERDGLKTLAVQDQGHQTLSLNLCFLLCQAKNHYQKDR